MILQSSANPPAKGCILFFGFKQIAAAVLVIFEGFFAFGSQIAKPATQLDGKRSRRSLAALFRSSSRRRVPVRVMGA